MNTLLRQTHVNLCATAETGAKESQQRDGESASDFRSRIESLRAQCGVTVAYLESLVDGLGPPDCSTPLQFEVGYNFRTHLRKAIPLASIDVQKPDILLLRRFQQYFERLHAAATALLTFWPPEGQVAASIAESI